MPRDVYGRRMRHIVTNPPFKLAEAFVRHGLDLLEYGDLLCLFLRLAFLESDTRMALWRTTPLARVHVSSARITMYPAGYTGEKGSSTTAHAWFVWQAGHTSAPELGWF